MKPKKSDTASTSKPQKRKTMKPRKGGSVVINPGGQEAVAMAANIGDVENPAEESSDANKT